MKNFSRPGFTFLFFLCFISVFSSFSSAQTLEERIDSLLNKMTLDEKILQLHQEGGFNTADNARLNVPGFIMADGPHGVRDGSATCFPVGIAMAASWDLDLVQRLGTAMGEEFRGKGKHQALGPAMDLNRDPRNGRSAESGGEDPYLDAQITTAAVKGIQMTPCLATIKHYNANHRENGRLTNNISVSQRMLMEYYGLYFRTAVQQGGAFSVMNAYNLINGEKSAENHNLLTTILKEKWGFPYYVVSDWGSIWDPGKAIKAGCDIEMGSTLYTGLADLVKKGTVPESAINEAVRRVLRTKFLSGMMNYYPVGNPDDVNSKAHKDLTVEAAKKVMVLLKNQDNILPLNKSQIKTIALIGPSADVMQIDGGGSAYVSPFYTVSPKAGLENKFGASNILFTRGCDINSSNTDGFAKAKLYAMQSDVVIFCGGLDPSQESEGMDRATGSIELPGKQQDLINELAAVNKNVIVVLFSGGICGLNQSIDKIKGLIYAFYPGQEGGTALAEVLFGDYNPGGKLPVTYPKTDSQLPAWDDDFTNDYGGGYRWFDKKGFIPLFPFGYGLSYTTFGYSNLVISPANPSYGEPVTVSLDVTNTGQRAGDEVPQLYLSRTQSAVEMPVKQLRGFKRITLEPGEKKTVTFTITNDELYYYNEADSSFTVEPGTFNVMAGGSSDNLPLKGSFQMQSGVKKPDFVITGIRTLPRYPLKGEKVQFLATVMNQGTGATSKDTKIKVLFKIDGKEVSWSTNYSAPVPAGGMALIGADGGPEGSYSWTAGNTGTFTLEATADYDNSVDECVESNNSFKTQLTVSPEPPKNLAFGKPVTVTSVEKPELGGRYAVDGSLSTRWSSAFSDPQTITVDLQDVYKIEQVVLQWEAAYGKQYKINLSEDGQNWTTVKYETNSDGGLDAVACSMNARYVRMYGIQRATEWGYSLLELQVFGQAVTDVKDETGLQKHFSYRLMDNYPNPFNPTTTITYEIAERSTVRIDIINLLGQVVSTLINSEHTPGIYSVRWNGRDNSGQSAASGIYLYRMQAGNFSESRKLLLLK
ncbi:MAG: T9SS type A sorting domain-containing protein [Ignavibacteria bacterium]|jgi:beta-glucosidase|nr:T9SS type A sorting domain-containing protein [Ignavibacteria bacterium]